MRLARAELRASIPEGCGSLAELQGELENRLDSQISLSTTSVTLTPEEGGYHLQVVVGSEQRELRDPSCRELLRAAVVIAVALLEPPRRDAPQPAVLVEPPRDRAREPSAQASASPLHFAIAPTVGVHIGTLPRPTLLLDLDAQLRWTQWGIAAGVRYLLPTSERDAANRGVRVGGLGAYVAGSFDPWPRVQARLGVVGYRLAGSGLGSVQQSDDIAWELAPTLGASFVPLERRPFWTAVGAEGQLNLLRARFQILNYNDVFQVPAVSGTAFVRAGLSW